MQFIFTTGEVFDLSTNEGLIEANRISKHRDKELKELKTLIANRVKVLAQDGEYLLNKLYKVEKKTIERRSYSMATLRNTFDEDQIATIVTPVNAKVDKLAKEILDKDQIKELNNSMIVVSSYDTFKIKEA